MALSSSLSFSVLLDRRGRFGCRARDVRGAVPDDDAGNPRCGANGELPLWVSAKDVILEMLRRRGVSGGVGKIIEYFGPGFGASAPWTGT